MEGVNETAQIVRVVADEGEKFFRISGRALTMSGRITYNIGKIMALFYKTIKNQAATRKMLGRGELYLSQMIEEARGRGCRILGAQISTEHREDFDSFANQKIRYAVLDENKGVTTILYPENYANQLSQYIVTHRDDAKAISIQTFAENITWQNINPKDDVYVDIYRQDIKGIDRSVGIVYLKTAENIVVVPTRDVQIKNNSEGRTYLTVKLRRGDSYNMGNSYMVKSVGSDEVYNRLQSYQKNRTQYLLNKIDYIKSNSELLPDMDRTTIRMLENPRLYEKDISEIYRRVKYGTDRGVISFTNGQISRVFVNKLNKQQSVMGSVRQKSKSTVRTRR